MKVKIHIFQKNYRPKTILANSMRLQWKQTHSLWLRYNQINSQHLFGCTYLSGEFKNGHNPNLLQTPVMFFLSKTSYITLDVLWISLLVDFLDINPNYVVDSSCWTTFFISNDTSFCFEVFFWGCSKVALVNSLIFKIGNASSKKSMYWNKLSKPHLC